MDLKQLLHLFENPEETRCRTPDEMKGTFEALLFTPQEMENIQECLKETLLEREFLEDILRGELGQALDEWEEQKNLRGRDAQM